MAERGSFGRLGFILAAVGSAIGLGNIWKFPYITYANDGGSFVLVYLIAILLIGAPIMFAELAIGRHTKLSAVPAFVKLGKEAFGGRAWGFVGGLGVLTGFVLLSYYAVIAGWTVYYFGRCLAWSVQGYDLEGPELGELFGTFLANGNQQIFFQLVFMALTIGTVLLGVKQGIERVTRTLMPVLLAIMVLLVISSFWSPGFGEAIRFLFTPNEITADGLLEAVGHSFFTLSLGMGAMITYGSYVSDKQSLPRAGLLICLLDTVIALMACVIMFSIIFSIPEAERATTFSRSATILFTTLPRMFYALPFGALLSPLFYLLVAFAALTSTISLLEVAVAYVIDSFGWARRKAALVVGLGVSALGVPAALSLGASEALSSWAPLGSESPAVGVFGVFDYTVSNWFLPVGGLLTAIFAGWVLKPELLRGELELGNDGAFRLFKVSHLLLRFVAPIAILWILWSVIHGRTF
jgi:NSS family neurotransmitter:Na+ symporter